LHHTEQGKSKELHGTKDDGDHLFSKGCATPHFHLAQSKKQQENAASRDSQQLNSNELAS
jgi:hypothetical protein